MGQICPSTASPLCVGHRHLRHSLLSHGRSKAPTEFPDLSFLPPEMAISILSHLSATELCLAGCVNEYWQELADSELLWKGLCYSDWGNIDSFLPDGMVPIQSYKRLYLLMDDGSSLFNGDSVSGLEFLLNNGVVGPSDRHIGCFLHESRRLHADKVLRLLQDRRGVLDELVGLLDFHDVFLPDALRKFFTEVPAPKVRGDFLEHLLTKFSRRYFECNRDMGLPQDTTYVLCYSLIMLSVDLGSPHVKNKMTKREFIRNLRGAVQGTPGDYLVNLYDNIYLHGHVAKKSHYKVYSNADF
eukprot:scpid75262/ scgid16540/ F-box only protein 8